MYHSSNLYKNMLTVMNFLQQLTLAQIELQTHERAKKVRLIALYNFQLEQFYERKSYQKR